MMLLPMRGLGSKRRNARNGDPPNPRRPPYLGMDRNTLPVMVCWLIGMSPPCGGVDRNRGALMPLPP